ncbi:MAG: hypothetical protein IPJ79_08870 [Bacteroidetes bacterium]|nr:hypothetical protein [Bacteroidota bacterium]
MVVPPKQPMLPKAAAVNGEAGSLTVPVTSDVHPLASVTMKEYAPAFTVNVPVPL